MTLMGSALAQSTGETVNPSLPPVAAKTEAGTVSTYAWAGTWFSDHYLGGYLGAMKSLNATGDLWTDGFVLRGDVSGGSYRYDSTGFVNVRVGTLDSDVMLGYRKNVGKGAFSAYVGPSYAFHHNPDPAAALRGDEFGAKFLAEYSGSLAQNLEGSLQGSYRTTFSTYSLTGRLLYRVSDSAWIGPQATLFGNDSPFRESTFGGVLKINTKFGEIGVSGGYRHVYTSGNSDGYFASAYLGIPFP
ncbi:cellulose biosynthesis protein BcsS [Sphingobium nicotianae]|nr:cellulose biosynthesis protein BcsS [Sphingobium nicotianae]